MQFESVFKEKSRCLDGTEHVHSELFVRILLISDSA